jgi:hypothetical protein
MSDNTKQPNPAAMQAPKPANDTGSISVEGFLRITDPNTKQVHVEIRG